MHLTGGENAPILLICWKADSNLNIVSKQILFAACGMLLAFDKTLAQSAPVPPPASKTAARLAGSRSTRAGRGRVTPQVDAKIAVPTEVPLDVVWSPDNRLSIRGNGSELFQILKQVSALTGIAIEGIVPHQPVFGVYGPGSAETVLAELLAGSGANYLLANVDRNGLPHMLKLGAESAAPAESASRSNNPGDGGTASVAEEDAADSVALGSGAIAHVPPNEQAQGAASPEQEAARIRQSMEKLRHIQEQQNGQQNAAH